MGRFLVRVLFRSGCRAVGGCAAIGFAATGFAASGFAPEGAVCDGSCSGRDVFLDCEQKVLCQRPSCINCVAHNCGKHGRAVQKHAAVEHGHQRCCSQSRMDAVPRQRAGPRQRALPESGMKVAPEPRAQPCPRVEASCHARNASAARRTAVAATATASLAPSRCSWKCVRPAPPS